jgi:hypothetical protein
LKGEEIASLLPYFFMKELSSIEIHLSLDTVVKICPVLFQKGILLKVNVGIAVNDFLLEKLNLEKTYINKRITTIFLNGKPVDNIDKAIIENYDTIALSASMPGLLGATLRRDSYLAPFRGTITFREHINHHTRSPGYIYLKLFNTISQEIGPILLKKGIIIDLEEFLRPLNFNFSKKENPRIFLNEKEIHFNEFRELQSKGKQKTVFLRVKIY